MEELTPQELSEMPIPQRELKKIVDFVANIMPITQGNNTICCWKDCQEKIVTYGQITSSIPQLAREYRLCHQHYRQVWDFVHEIGKYSPLDEVEE